MLQGFDEAELIGLVPVDSSVLHTEPPGSSY